MLSIVKNKISKSGSGELLKVFSFTGLSMLVKLVTSFLMVKVVAAIIGPAGTALVGQLQNFIAIFTSVGSGGMNNGVVKLVAENHEDEAELKTTISTGFLMTLAFAAVSGLISAMLSVPLSRWILHDESYYYLFIIFGVCLVLVSLNNFFLSVVNGFTKYRTYVIISMVTSLAGLLFTVILALLYRLPGVLIAIVSYQAVVLFVTLFILRREQWLTADLWRSFLKSSASKYFAFTAMAFVTALTVPVAQLIIRSYLIDGFSLTIAGLWESINKISAMYMLFITSSFSVYYLPKLSQTKSEFALKTEILKTYRVMLPVVAISLTVVYFLREIVIRLVFTEQFLAMEPLFKWQLLGDFFKVCSWLLAFVMVAKSMTKPYIITEIVFSGLMVLSSVFFIGKNGAIGATQAYCLTYLLYCIVMIILFRKILLAKSI